MKLRIILLGLVMVITNQHANAQEEINFGDLPKPVPSVSSLSTYVNTPASIATGIPDISYPLIKIPTSDKKIEMGVSLSYHVGNVNQNEAAGEVGTGWSLLAGGVISREVVSEVDERYDNTATGDYQKNIFDDLYYYSFPGGSGKFRINRNTGNNTFSLENLSPNKIKFEFTRESNNATLILSSFTLTDEKGYKYLFNDYSVSTMSLSFFTRKEYKSAFFLSKIITPSEVEIVSFTYQKDNRYIPNTSNLAYRSCKLKTIESKDFGSIVIDYNYENLENTMNDPYSVTAVSLKNKVGSLIEKYLFEYATYGYNYNNVSQSKRMLMSIKKTDKNSAISEKTSFVYDSSGSETFYNPNSNYPYGQYLCFDGNEDPRNKTLGTLKRVNLPTGGHIEYNYEANQAFTDKNLSSQTINESSFGDPEIQYIKSFSDIDFDTHLATIYPLSITTSNPTIQKQFFISFQVSELYTGGPLDPTTGNPGDYFVNYVLKSGSQVIDPIYCASNPNLLTYSLSAGNYTLQTTGTGGKGIFQIYDIATIPPPYKNATSYVQGVRIKNIKNFDNFFTIEPKKTVQYEYEEFANPMNSSGYVFSNEDNGNSNTVYLPYVLYKNVKVKEDNNGYTKYYFKLPTDYPFLNLPDNTVDPNFLPFYNITKKGILDKVEAYNSQNQLLNSKTFEYTFDVVANTPEYIIYGNVKSWPSWIKGTKIIEKQYTAGTQNFVENIIESSYGSSNYELASTKRTSSDGNIMEKKVKYALDKANTALINANMINIPLETETKNNGKLVEKTETKFEIPSQLLPSSVIVTTPSDSSLKTLVRYDSYNAKGNPVQYTVNADTDGTGNPVVIIWGYNQTLPIAKIEGAKLSDIGSLADDIINKSNLDIDTASELTLANALDSFRTNAAMKNFLITTYTYDPLVGITTLTPPTGIKQIYKYDQSNRLKTVLDVNGNIINDYKYNTKPTY
jgi:uncharacterized protein YutD